MLVYVTQCTKGVIRCFRWKVCASSSSATSPPARSAACCSADMGADVIKVEHPQGGDTMRAWPPITDGYSENFASLNRNKRSVTLDLKDPQDREQATRARAGRRRADREQPPRRDGAPGARLREPCKREKPTLVYCSISAFGQEGPRAEEGGFDLTMQAMSGIMSVTGEPGGAPVKCGVPLSDFCAGLYAAYAIAAVLRRVQQGGDGEHIDVSMLGASLAIAALQTSEYFGTGRDPAKLGSAHPRNAPYQAFKAKRRLLRDGGRQRRAVARRLRGARTPRARGRSALRLDHAAREEPGRAEGDRRGRVRRMHAAARCSRKFRAAGVPCAPINTYSERSPTSRCEHMEWVQEITLPSGQTHPHLRLAAALLRQGLPDPARPARARPAQRRDPCARSRRAATAR